LTPFAWFLGLFLPACGAQGAAGLPPPVLTDMTKIERTSTANTYLAGPAGMRPEPDMTIEAQALPAPELYEKARVTFGGMPRTFVAAEFPRQRQLHYVVRSEILNFPDLVTVQVNPAGADHATIVIWSRSVYGRSDFGVNRERTKAWLAALQQSIER